MWEFSQPDLSAQSIDRLRLDQAFVNITSSLTQKLWMYELSEECFECPYTKFKQIQPSRTIGMRVDASRQLTWKFYSEDLGRYAYNETPYCQIVPNDFGEFGVYNIILDSKGNCSFRVVDKPVPANSSIFYVLILLFGIFGIIKGLRNVRARRLAKEPSEASTATLNEDQPEQQKPSPKSLTRISSLDTFRGLAIVTMIFANSGAGRYWWLEHAAWNGIHFADFVFPSFLWIMGVCIPISVKSQLAKNIPKKEIIHSIIIRSIKLFLIGLCIHTAHGPKFSDIRTMDVLQRFGIAYFVTASLYVLLGKPTRSNEEQEIEYQKWKKVLEDIIALIPQWLIMFGIVIIHLLITFCLPVPGCPTGYLGPGGKHEMGKYNNCIGGATAYVDRLILGAGHMYQHPRAGAVYDETRPFDPEGIFGCLLTIVQVFLGVQCGQTLLYFSDWKGRVKRWISWSAVTFVLGGVLCKFSIDNGWIPINKNMWSLSFVLVTVAFAYLLFSLFYYVIDVRKWWSGTPLVQAGMNAILMYVGSELLGQMYPFYWHFGSMNTHFMFLVQNIWTTGMWVLVAHYLYSKKIFVNL